MKFRGHETFSIRKGWLSKGLKNVVANPEVFVSKTENPMDVLGIGSNMVKSLRYWMQGTGLTEEPKSGKRTQKLTELGEVIYSNDKYIEELGTLQLLHYKLVTNKDNVTSWYYFFNEFDLKEFDKDDFIRHIKSYLQMNNVEVAEKSLESDFSCIINTYLPKHKSDKNDYDPENNLESPLSELGLIDVANKSKKTYKFNSINALNPLIVLAVIIDRAADQREIKISSIYNDLCNVGKVFKTDIITLTNILYKLEILGYIKVVRTAGMDVITIEKDLNFIDCVKEYYASISD